MSAGAILAALRALVSAAVPTADVRGFIEDTTLPERVPASGVIAGEPGDPGDPEVELSPVAYTYTHHIPVEAFMPVVSSGTFATDAQLRALIAPIGAAIGADRFLTGLVSWIEVSAPQFSSDLSHGAVPLRVASFDFIAEYTVSDPLAD